MGDIAATMEARSRCPDPATAHPGCAGSAREWAWIAAVKDRGCPVAPASGLCCGPASAPAVRRVTLAVANALPALKVDERRPRGEQNPGRHDPSAPSTGPHHAV